MSLKGVPVQKATTPAGFARVKQEVKVKVRPGDAASSVIAGAKKHAKETKDRELGLKEKGKQGDPLTPNVPAATSRDQRLAMSKKQSGPMVLYDFDEDNGFFEVQRTLRGERLLALNAFFDGYRADPNRDFQEKRRFPISSIQVIRRNLGKRRGVQEKDIVMPTNTQYMLTSVRMATKDVIQIIKTFSGFRILAFDGEPQVWSFQGVLMNTENENWFANWRANYVQYMSPVQCARMGTEVVLTFQDFLVAGIITNPSMGLDANSDGAVPFSFNMILLEESVFSTNAVLQKATRYKSAFQGPRPSGLTTTLVHEAYAKKYGTPESRGGARKLSSEDIKKLPEANKKEIEEFLQAYPAYNASQSGV